MHVVVAGGTGLVGRAIVDELLAGARHLVTVASRHAPPSGTFPAAVAWRRADVTQAARLASALAGADAVVDAVQFPNSPMEDPAKGFTFERVDLGGTRHLVAAAREAGVPLFIGLSGAGAAHDGRYHWLRCKALEEDAIRESGLAFTIFRPAMVFGPHDVALNRMLGFGRFLPFVPVIGDGETRLRPLFIRDLAAHVAAALSNERARGGTFEIGGPDLMTMDEMLRTALRVSGRRRFLLHQPKRLMKAAAQLAQHLPGRPLTPDAVDFVTMEGDVDNGPLLEAFGLPLTPFETALAAYLA